MPFCTRPVYSGVLLFSIPCFGLIIYLLFIDQKKIIVDLSIHVVYALLIDKFHTDKNENFY